MSKPGRGTEVMRSAGKLWEIPETVDLKDSLEDSPLLPNQGTFGVWKHFCLSYRGGRSCWHLEGRDGGTAYTSYNAWDSPIAESDPGKMWNAKFEKAWSRLM